MAQRRQTPKEKFAQIKAAHLKKVGGQSSLFPSSIPERATKKALLALQSELRRLERTLNEREERLERWEEDLRCREADLADVIENEFEEDECYCDEGTCNLHPDQDHDTITEVFGGTAREVVEKDKIGEQLKVAEEVLWLENLFALKDKRRKK